MRNGPILHLFKRLFLISWENNRYCYITMPLSLKTMEVQVYWGIWWLWGRFGKDISSETQGRLVGSGKQGGENFQERTREPQGFHDSSERFSVIGHKNAVWRKYLSHCFRDLLIRRGLLFAVPVWLGQESFLREEFRWKWDPKTQRNSIICKMSVQPFSLIMHTTISYYFVQIVYLNRVECIINAWGYTEVLPHNLVR